LPRLLGPDFVPCTVDCQNQALVVSPAEFFAYTSRRIVHALSKRGMPGQPVAVGELAYNPFVVFDRWLTNIQHVLGPRMRILVCFDEYERLARALEAGWGLALFDSLRHIIQHHEKIAFLFSGVHTFEQMGPIWTDTFISARRIRVSFLRRDEIVPLLTAPVPEFDMSYAPRSVDLIFDKTKGQPCLTQGLASELVDLLNEDGRREARPEDVLEAANRSLETTCAEYLANVWHDAGKEGQEILAAAIRGGRIPEHPAAERWLRDNDIMDERGVIVVPMVADSVARRIS